MEINQDEARKWSKDRIKEEIEDLRRHISEYNNYIYESLEEERESENEERERQARVPYAKERVFDDSDQRDNLRSAISRNEEDIEFLKSLLDGNPNISSNDVIKNVPGLENSRQDTYVKSVDRVIYASPQTRAPCGRRGVGGLPTIGDEMRRRCFIATAVYGNETIPEVKVLREFRDNVLMQSRLGKVVVDLYYGGLGKKVATLIKERFPQTIPIIKRGLDYLVDKYAKQDM